MMTDVPGIGTCPKIKKVVLFLWFLTCKIIMNVVAAQT